MLVLALDTSTPVVTAGLVDLTGESPRTLAEKVEVSVRGHAEVLTPRVLEVLTSAGHTPADLGAVVVGCGPGPFTGLRVGMATGAAFADALGVPVHGVCSLDAIAVRATASGHDRLLVVTDARRREIYWARYEDGRRVEGPAVAAPADVAGAPSEAVAGSPAHAEAFALPVVDVVAPDAASLVAVAAGDLRSGTDPAPLEPLYLRRPDAVPLAERAGR
ncbi:tRNA (adenosine(37)-N6)-threonylcarbamoyltransferase complex dimerization subunit type 1 TsaB [Rhodococcus rhodnii]|uniref:Gcp-like domain-containing protein n=2 Tax=Rhodococcus rhodnii TaxID=38312 RepID=R7WTM2_9NOCA|nr:tRNA (adenosine(37)-N6)-threonylcarbamoyltransferase complex dimerization subunit type 1 TsaB [Rhodococcus rhodnii]EOM78621.1 hypothetical protein Rrhod_0010 [Rhodococcus rhodnii LMG 5362]TXG90446.1 tRNA (adenosine(37)-N6)-threonylcarbamoyltransferase complex dimerization subunit type 1 TsaB [Rhodococcus rhodnii]